MGTGFFFVFHMKHLPNNLRAEVIEMVKKLVNLTPHPINIYLNGEMITIPPSGMVARVQEIVEDAGSLEVAPGVVIPLRIKRLGDKIEGLPEPQEDTIYIVSLLAAQAAWAAGRKDVVATGDPVRDHEGRVTGVSSLYVKP
jgi:hypothetical protein